jgi:glycosyltransferase involved in cell wall biosynthesis
LGKNMEFELTVLMPCLNEEKTLEVCIEKIRGFFQSHKVNGEVLVADNGSTDGSVALCEMLGVRVIGVKEKGYGAALMGGIGAAKGKYIIMGDADDSYDFENLAPFLDKLRGEYDLVIGNRFEGGIDPGAMPLLHKYLGNPVLSYIGKKLFKTNIRDFHCGLRGFSTQKIKELGLQTKGMEFASEMVAKAALNDLKIVEVATTLKPDGRDRAPHLRSWQDGWRHLRFMLILCPRWLFFYPGLMFGVLGLLLSVCVYADYKVMGVGLGVHSLLYGASFMIVSIMLIGVALCSRQIGEYMGLFKKNKKIERIYGFMTLEHGLVMGIVLVVVSGVLSTYVSGEWLLGGFDARDPERLMMVVIPAVTLFILGIFCMVFSFMLEGIKIYCERDM